jgi:hypothetical protein
MLNLKEYASNLTTKTKRKYHFKIKLMKTNIHRIKDMIIYNILLFLETKENQHKKEAVRLLEVMIKHYNININNKKTAGTIKGRMMEFIDNKQGYLDKLIR